MLGGLEDHEKRNPNHLEVVGVINKCQQIMLVLIEYCGVLRLMLSPGWLV